MSEWVFFRLKGGVFCGMAGVSGWIAFERSGCPYIFAYIKKHPEWKRIVSPKFDGYDKL